MKTVSILLMDPDNNSVLFRNGRLPSIQTEDDNSVSVAINLLNSLGYDSCLLSPIVQSLEEEVWQPILWSAHLTEEEASLTDSTWVAMDEADLPNAYKARMYRKNLAKVISQKMSNEKEVEESDNWE